VPAMSDGKSADGWLANTLDRHRPGVLVREQNRSRLTCRYICQWGDGCRVLL
jgi:hypothetical protein